MNTIEQTDRGIPDVNKSRQNRAIRGLLFFALVAGVGLTAIASVWQFDSSEPESASEQRTAKARQSTVKPRTFVSVEPEPVITPAMELLAALPAPEPEPKVVYRSPPKPKVIKGLNGSKVVDNSATIQPIQVEQAGQVSTDGLFPTAGTGLEAQLKPTKLQATSASQLQNRDYLLTQGNTIDCALSTALNSTVAGLTSCRVTRDIFSSNGKLVLIERGSRITGEYKKSIKQGENRIFVLWSRLETPHGIIIDLDSPATGPLGGGGVPGHVDNKFWQRFGAAFLLSLVDDIARAVTDTQDTETGQIVIGSASAAGGSIASEILRDTINIPPTLYANQGARVSVFVARDLDFSTVYEAR